MFFGEHIDKLFNFCKIFSDVFSGMFSIKITFFINQIPKLTKFNYLYNITNLYSIFKN